MENGDIESTQITTSSGTGIGRLNVNTWKPETSDVNPYISVSFPHTTQITGITVMGSNKKFYKGVAIMYTIDGVVDTLMPETGIVSTAKEFYI